MIKYESPASTRVNIGVKFEVKKEIIEWLHEHLIVERKLLVSQIKAKRL